MDIDIDGNCVKIDINMQLLVDYKQLLVLLCLNSCDKIWSTHSSEGCRLAVVCTVVYKRVLWVLMRGAVASNYGHGSGP